MKETVRDDPTGSSMMPESIEHGDDGDPAARILGRAAAAKIQRLAARLTPVQVIGIAKSLKGRRLLSAVQFFMSNHADAAAHFGALT